MITAKMAAKTEWDALRMLVRKHMKDNDLTQTGVAEKIGVKPATVSLFLEGERKSGPSLALLAGLARLLGVQMEDLLPSDVQRRLRAIESTGDHTSEHSEISAEDLREREATERLRMLAQDILVALHRAPTQSVGKAGSAPANQPGRTQRSGKSH